MTCLEETQGGRDRRADIRFHILPWRFLLSFFFPSVVRPERIANQNMTFHPSARIRTERNGRKGRTRNAKESDWRKKRHLISIFAFLSFLRRHASMLRTIDLLWPHWLRMRGFTSRGERGSKKVGVRSLHMWRPHSRGLRGKKWQIWEDIFGQIGEGVKNKKIVDVIDGSPLPSLKLDLAGQNLSPPPHAVRKKTFETRAPTAILRDLVVAITAS